MAMPLAMCFFDVDDRRKLMRLVHGEKPLLGLPGNFHLLAFGPMYLKKGVGVITYDQLIALEASKESP